MRFLLYSFFPILPTLFIISCNSNDPYYFETLELRTKVSELTKRLDDLESLESFQNKKSEIQALINNENLSDANLNFKSLKTEYKSDIYFTDIEYLEKKIQDLSYYIDCKNFKNIDTINHYLKFFKYSGNYYTEVKDIRNKIEEEKFKNILNDYSLYNLKNYLLSFENGIYYDTVLLIYQDKLYTDIFNNTTQHNSYKPQKNENNEYYGNTKNKSNLESYHKSYNQTGNNYPPNSYSQPYVHTNPNANPIQIYIEPYYKKDGTYVKGHYRTKPNSTKTDNIRY